MRRKRNLPIIKRINLERIVGQIKVLEAEGASQETLAGKKEYAIKKYLKYKRKHQIPSGLAIEIRNYIVEAATGYRE